MPTTAKLTAAVLLAVLGWFAADLVKPYLAEGRPVGLFSPISAGFGALIGWTFTGRRLHRGRGPALGIGLASAALLVFWVVLGFSLYEMVQRSMSLRYGGPTEALEAMVKIAVENLAVAAQPDVIGALLLGGAIVGGVTRWVGGRFR